MQRAPAVFARRGCSQGLLARCARRQGFLAVIRGIRLQSLQRTSCRRQAAGLQTATAGGRACRFCSVAEPAHPAELQRGELAETAELISCRVCRQLQQVAELANLQCCRTCPPCRVAECRAGRGCRARQQQSLLLEGGTAELPRWWGPGQGLWPPPAGKRGPTEMPKCAQGGPHVPLTPSRAGFVLPLAPQGPKSSRGRYLSSPGRARLVGLSQPE